MISHLFFVTLAAIPNGIRCKDTEFLYYSKIFFRKNVFYMEIFERILTKDEINTRFIWAVNAVLRNRLMPSKASLAESLGVKPAKFSEILNGRMKVGIDMIAIMCNFYHVSPDWLLMSRGNQVFRNTPLPKIWVDDDDLDSNYPDEAITIKKASEQNSNAVEPLITLIQNKDNVIREQAEEIGRLKALIADLEQRIRAAEDTHTEKAAG